MAIQELLGGTVITFTSNGSIKGDWELSGVSCGIFFSTGRAGELQNLLGECCLQIISEGRLTRFVELIGITYIQVMGEGRPSFDWSCRGEAGFAILQSLAQIQRYQNPVTDSKLHKYGTPYLGGSVKLTYNTGVPYATTYWEVIGVAENGWEIDPAGSLKWTTVRADINGYAVNYYLVPTDPNAAGKKDRIRVDGRLV